MNGNSRKGQMTGTTSSDLISTKQGEIAALAGIEPRRVLTTLAHRIDIAWMREAYRRTRKDGAVGVDAVDRKTFEESIDANLAGAEAKFWVRKEIVLERSDGFDARTLRRLAVVVEQHRQEIEESWREHFG